MIELGLNTEDSYVKILVIGIGNIGNNAVTKMSEKDMKGINFICTNMNTQPLKTCKSLICIQIDDKLKEHIKYADMIFVICDLDDKTATNAPIVAKMAKEIGILTVGVVTHMNNSLNGIEKLKENVDTLILIPTDKFEILQQCIQEITNTFNLPGLVNIDFLDIQTILKDRGLAHIGIGIGKGDNKCIKATQKALESPLLEIEIKKANSIILNISGDTGLIDASNAASFLQKQVDEDVSIVYGVNFNETTPDTALVTIIATGFKM